MSFGLFITTPSLLQLYHQNNDGRNADDFELQNLNRRPAQIENERFDSGQHSSERSRTRHHREPRRHKRRRN